MEKGSAFLLTLFYVREKGLEPSRLATLVPETSASTISPLAQMWNAKIGCLLNKSKIKCKFARFSAYGRVE